MSLLKGKYRKEVIPALMEKGGYKNVMQVPRLEKVVLNIGVGEAIIVIIGIIGWILLFLPPSLYEQP